MIYLDHAATSFPKPCAVIEETWRCLTRYGGNPGRSGHALSLAASKKIFECRALAAELFGIDDPARVIFTMNTTQGLNTVIKGALREGDHVVISDLEHNAVYRPIVALAEEGKITYDVFPTMVGAVHRSASGICAEIARLCRPETRMVVATCASNICSATLPIAEIGAFCRSRGILFVADGAQAAGHVPLAVDALSLDALCVPGHKGLYGPQGCGMVILGKDFLPDPLVEGGNGVDSLSGLMPLESPERFEAGTLPTPAIAGLSEGLKWVMARGVESIHAHEVTLYHRAREALGNMFGVTMYAPMYEGAVLSFNVDGLPSERVAGKLNERGICVRGGYHCSALGHKTLGTPDGGAVRASFGANNTVHDVDALIHAVAKITGET